MGRCKVRLWSRTRNSMIQCICSAESAMKVSLHYNDVIMGKIASQITSLAIVYSTVYSDADQRKHQSSASLAFVRGIHRGPVNSPHKWPVTRKMFPFDDVIMNIAKLHRPSRSRSSDHRKLYSNILTTIKHEEQNHVFIVMVVAVDGMTPLGAKASANTFMTQIRSCTCSLL